MVISWQLSVQYRVLNSQLHCIWASLMKLCRSAIIKIRESTQNNTNNMIVCLAPLNQISEGESMLCRYVATITRDLSSKDDPCKQSFIPAAISFCLLESVI